MERWLRVREREGLSFAEVAQRSGIPVGTLANWAGRLRRSATDVATEGFVELVAAGDSSGAETAGIDVVTLRSASGARIELRGRFAEQMVARLLEQMGSWC
jgi:transcriptional regulator with XRE-family HTH domain